MASVLAAQLYTLRDHLKTPADIAESLKKVRQIGYEAVQLSGLGKIDSDELARILKGEGLAVCATHASLERMKNQTQEFLEDHQKWGCRYTAIGGFFPKAAQASDWLEFADEYNIVAEKLSAGGVRLGYHNHSHELAHFDGKQGLEILWQRFARNVWMEIDTYWIAHGGADPAAWIAKVAGRIPCVHLKDMGIDLNRVQFMAEVGEGNLNWPAILSECGKAGVEWYIVEQDVCQRDPFTSLAISRKNLLAMGLV